MDDFLHMIAEFTTISRVKSYYVLVPRLCLLASFSVIFGEMIKTLNSIAAIIIFLTANTVFSQTGESRLTDSGGGYSFAAPAGWKSKASEEGFGLVNPAETIILAVKSHNYQNFAAFAADANLERNGLELIGKPQDIPGGSTFRTTKNTTKGRIVIDTCVLFSPHGGGAIIAAFSDEANSAAAFETGISVAKSVRFVKPRQTAAGGSSQSALSGKHLLYLYTASGYTERKDIYLCASGGFYQSTDLGGFTPNESNGSSFGSLRAAHGTWKVSPNGAKLVLSFRNGGTVEYQISKRQASNEIGLNGKRFFVQSQDKCR